MLTFNIYWTYFTFTCHHKWLVFLECCKVGLYWRGVIHDWDKFLPSQFIPYAQHFHQKHTLRPKGYSFQPGEYLQNATADYQRARARHYRLQEHHPEHWVTWANGQAAALKMSKDALWEMCCDMQAINIQLTQTGYTQSDPRTFYQTHGHLWPMHRVSRAAFEKLIIDKCELNIVNFKYDH